MPKHVLLRKNHSIVQNSFSELMRLLVLLALTFAAAIFGSFWVWALTAALGWTAISGLREKFRAA